MDLHFLPITIVKRLNRLKGTRQLGFIFSGLNLNGRFGFQVLPKKHRQRYLTNILKPGLKQARLPPGRLIKARKLNRERYWKINMKNTEQIFNGKQINRPNFWGGYCIKPVKMEFWQGRENRLHDRILYEKQDEKWITKRLAP